MTILTDEKHRLPRGRPASTASSADGAAAGEALRRLRQLVGDSARRWKRWMILEAVSIAIGVPLAALWLVLFLDNLFHLPLWGRLLANVVLLAATIYLVGSLVRRWRGLHFTEDQVALAMERRTPNGVDNRLINALQISRDPRAAGVDVGQAVIEENYTALRRVVLQQAGQRRPAVLRATFACIAVVAGILFWSLQREHFTNAATRIMLPLANVDPIYSTVLSVRPGDVEGGGDVVIRVEIKGSVPAELTVLRVADGRRTGATVAVAPGRSMVEYTLRSVDRDTTYAVRGGDYTSPFYTIRVPTPSSLKSATATYRFPGYTRLAEKTIESTGGDLEAVVGTKVSIVFTVDRAAGEAALLLHRVKPTPATQPDGARPANSLERLPLRKLGPTVFSGELTFADVAGYQLETRQENRAPDVSARYAIHVRVDQEPVLQVAGLDKRTEATAETDLPLMIDASDDFGLTSVGLYARRISGEATQPTADRTAPAADGGWVPVQVWAADNAVAMRKDLHLLVASLGAAEGDQYEVAPRAADADPAKAGQLVTGPSFTIVVGGADVALQLLYEQIVRTESGLNALIVSEGEAIRETTAWMQKLNAASGLRWDDQANLDALAAGVKAIAARQEGVRQTAGAHAREMVAQAGSLRLSLALLADTEMLRVTRIVESVPTQDSVQRKRASMADAKMAQERTIKSLREILDQHSTFRHDWELANMLPFIKMLADRQAVLRDESKAAASATGPSADAVRLQGASRRQAKVGELTKLAQAAFVRLAPRLKADDALMGDAFEKAAAALGATELGGAMADAVARLKEGQWADAAPKQDVAAKLLSSVHQQLQAAKLEAAKQALAAMQEKAKSDVEAQKEIERLRAGSGENALQDIDAAQLKVADIIHMREVAAGKKAADAEAAAAENPYRLDDTNSAALHSADSGKRQQFDNLKLATSPTGAAPRFPNQSDRAGNSVKPHIQQEFQDLVGKLLEEADVLAEKYDTYNINIAANIDEAGEVSKQGGDLNSTAAAAATGNQKPPPNDQGGISRQGRMGGRAHGMMMGEEGVNRRGRDKVQEGQERVPDQAGTIKQAHSDDEQPDTSTGIGGKKVETDRETTFNTSDKGTFTDDMAERMGKVAAKNAIVERQDGKIDPRVAAMLRDLNGTQEQVIERLKVIRKELKNLYLPTDQVDDAMAQLAANLESLKERPSADLFRLQADTLSKLRGTLSVFTQYGAGFQPSLPRDQAVRGRVLDEPARRPIPEYDEAVKLYYDAMSPQ